MICSSESNKSFHNMMENHTDVCMEQLNQTAMSVSYTVIDILLFVVIVTGNTLVVFAYHTANRLKTVTNFFIIHLAYADLGVGLTMPFHIATFVCQKILNNVTVCVFRYALIIMSVAQSVMTLLLMTIDRYVAITKPFEHNYIMSTTRARTAITVTWAISVTGGFVAPMVWYNNYDTLPSNSTLNTLTSCSIIVVLKYEYIAYLLLPTVTLIAIAIVAFYIHLYCVARNKLRQMVQNNLGNAQFKEDVKTTKTVGMVLGFFLLCWVPFLVLLACEVYFDMRNNDIINNIRGYVSLLVILNSGLNPFIYAFRMNDFKNEFKKIVCCKKSTNSRSGSQTESAGDH